MGSAALQPESNACSIDAVTLDLSTEVAILRRSVAMLAPGERAINREQAFVILERLDEVEGQLRHLREGVRQLLVDVDPPVG
jgi:hypothetical protein